jgi:hypothetical protein
LYIADGKRSVHKATCQGCEYGTGLNSTPADFAQFFPADEKLLECARALRRVLVADTGGGDFTLAGTFVNKARNDGWAALSGVNLT